MANNTRAVPNPMRDRLFDGLHGRRQMAEPTAGIHLVCGREHILALQPMLMQLARRTGQTGAMDSLDFYLTLPYVQKKTPYLVLVGVRPGVDAERIGAGDVQGAVLLHEYKLGLLRGRVFVIEDGTGHRTVIASAESRMEVAELACRELMNRGAVMVLVSLEAGQGPRPAAPVTAGPSGCWIGKRSRVLPSYLPLAATVEQTLARLGRHTRRNLRYYRRRAELQFGARFVSSVEIGRENFLELNRASTRPIAERDAEARYESMKRLRRPIFLGVQAADGQWLSLLGGRRQEGSSEIDWQMNRAGFPRQSLSTVMRAYLLEHEVAAGTRKIFFEGGTPHSMRLSFVHSTIVDILVRREGLRAWFLCRFARRIFPEANFLRDTLGDPSLIWQRW